jgi:hypothetical protein
MTVREAVAESTKEASTNNSSVCLSLRRELDERTRRLWAATEAQALGHGGVAAVARATGMAESTIRLGRHDLSPTSKSAGLRPPGRVRQPGGGRKRLTKTDQTLLAALDALVEQTARGDPMSPLRWTNKSTRQTQQLTLENIILVPHV